MALPDDNMPDVEMSTEPCAKLVHGGSNTIVHRGGRTLCDQTELTELLALPLVVSTYSSE